MMLPDEDKEDRPSVWSISTGYSTLSTLFTGNIVFMSTATTALDYYNVQAAQMFDNQGRAAQLAAVERRLMEFANNDGHM